MPVSGNPRCVAQGAVYPVSYPGGQFPGVGKADVASEDVENPKAI